MKRTAFSAVLGGILALCPGASARTLSLTIDLRAPAAPARDAIEKLSKPLSGEFKGDRLEDAISYIAEVTGVAFEPLWIDDDHAAGLDREHTVALKFESLGALTLLERVLGAVPAEFSGGCTWQVTERGTVQVGPRVRLNEFKRIEVYPVGDLLRETPEFTNAPSLDLQSALQNQGSGGGSVFRESPQNAPGAGPGGTEAKSPETSAEQLIALLARFIEPEQWRVNGGDGAEAEYFQGTLIVRAPEYVHRQINGSRAR